MGKLLESEASGGDAKRRRLDDVRQALQDSTSTITASVKQLESTTAASINGLETAIKKASLRQTIRDVLSDMRNKHYEDATNHYNFIHTNNTFRIELPRFEYYDSDGRMLGTDMSFYANILVNFMKNMGLILVGYVGDFRRGQEPHRNPASKEAVDAASKFQDEVVAKLERLIGVKTVWKRNAQGPYVILPFTI